MTRTLSLALRLLRRERRAGDLRIVTVATVIAVTSVVSVASFADRLHQALLRQGSELLAADLMVRTSFPPKQAWIDESRRRGLRNAQTVSFRSVVAVADRTQLAEIKAVEPGYPLRGTLRVAEGVGHQSTVSHDVPASGAVWVDSQFLALVRARVGETVQVGYQQMVIEKVVVLEPDRGGAFFAIAPRLLMNVADLSATRLVQPGSLVSYRWLLAGTPSQLASFRQWLERETGSGVSFHDVSNMQPRFRAALDRGERFLGLATLVSVLLAGVAVARAARHYAGRHLDSAAIMRCLGARQTQIVGIFLGQLLMIGGVASAVGCAIGYVGQQVFVYLLPGLIVGQLPWPSATPAVIGFLVGMVALLGFAAPIILRLRAVPPLRVMRRDLGALPTMVFAVYLTALFVLTVLIVWMARDTVLSAYVLIGGALTIALLTLISYLAVHAIKSFRHGVGITWRFGIANLARRGAESISQIVSLGIGIMAMLLLTIVRGDLLEAWQTTIPDGTPNHFLINIQPQQVAEVEVFFKERGWGVPRLRPIVRARLSAINGHPVRAEDFEDGFAKRAVQRAANLSWTGTLQRDNRVVDGEWWKGTQLSAPLISVEKHYAEALRLKLGDVLTYRLADRELKVTIANLRAVAWDSFKPNFFLLVPPKLLSEYPTSYITSVYLPRIAAPDMQSFINQFPNVTDIDVDALLLQVRRLIDRVNVALQYVFLFTLAAGVVVLYAAIQTGHRERTREVAVLRALGAGRRQLWWGVAAEFCVIGLLAGAVGALAAMVIGAVLSEYVLNIPYRWNLNLWWLGLAGGGALVTLIGTFSTSGIRNAAAWRLLRES